MNDALIWLIYKKSWNKHELKTGGPLAWLFCTLRLCAQPVVYSQITPSSQARNLGVIFDSTMTLKPHISNIVRVSSFHIRNISRIRKYLNQSAAEQIIHAFVTSRLDNGNALFYGLPQNQISRLQHIQNTAARVVTLSRNNNNNNNKDL